MFANLQRRSSLPVAREPPVSGKPLLFPNEFFRILLSREPE